MTGIVIGMGAGIPERCIALQAPTVKYAKIMLLGEAPGEEEEKAGQPFVGRAGKLLDSLLEGAGVLRTSCAVTNVFHVRPPGNEIMRFFTGESLEADAVLKPYRYKNAWLRAEYGDEIKRLMEELKTWKPKVIVALGATALWAMTGRTDISKCLGQPLPVQTHIVLPCFHPAYLLRMRDPLLNQRAVEVLQGALDYAVVN